MFDYDIISKSLSSVRPRPAALFVLAVFAACGEDDGTSPNADPLLPEGATMALLPSVAYQAPGSTQQFHAILRDAEGASPSLAALSRGPPTIPQ